MHRLRGLRAGMPGRRDQAGHRTGAREMAVAECGTRENLAKYYGKKSAPARLEGVGGEAGQTPIFFTQARNRGLNDSLSTIPLWPCDADWTVNMTVALTL